ncbi:uncharacterized protein LOC135819886 [Sycon ciliatum]|uniref:uncharacterized protein LOC135819886 n=1 Tax=Sycon ciliatum TaxID=27933 RepID=UPI0031F6FEA9
MCINASVGSNVLSYRVPDAALYLGTAVAIASCLCSISIIAVHVLLRFLSKSGPGMQAHSRMFVVFISVCDVGTCVLNSLGSLTYGQPGTRTAYLVCQWQATLGIMLNMAFVLWVLSFVVFLYIMIPRDKIKSAIKYRLVFHCISWGIPIALALIVYFVDAVPSAPRNTSDVSLQSSDVINQYSRATVGWCWIAEQPAQPSGLRCDQARLLWMLVAGRGWEVLAYVVMGVLVFLIRRYVTTLNSPLSQLYSHPNGLLIKGTMKTISGKAYALVVTFIFLRVWGTIRVLFDYGDYYNEHPTVNLVFVYFQAVGDNAQGVVNLILFVLMAPKIRGELAAVLCIRCRHCCCCCCYHCDDWRYRRQKNVSEDSGGLEESAERPAVLNVTVAPRDASLSSQLTTTPPTSLTVSSGGDPDTAVANGIAVHTRVRRPHGRSNASSSDYRSSATELEMTESHSPRSWAGKLSRPHSRGLDLSQRSQESYLSASSINSYHTGRSSVVPVSSPITEDTETVSLYVPSSSASSATPMAYESLPAATLRPTSPKAAAQRPKSPKPAPRPKSPKPAAARPPMHVMASTKTPLLSDTDDYLP